MLYTYFRKSLIFEVVLRILQIDVNKTQGDKTNLSRSTKFVEQAKLGKCTRETEVRLVITKNSFDYSCTLQQVNQHS